jgi:short-subunit dehydrogenase
MPGKVAVVIGAYSGIATAIARELAARRYALVLVARDAARLAAAAEDLRARGAEVLRTDCVDLLDHAASDALFDALARDGIRADVVLVAQGVMSSNEECRQDAGVFRRMVELNFCSAAWCAERALALFDPAAGGELIVISSVAGERGRPKNYFYGATKAGLDAFLEGLRLAQTGTRVNVMNLKPGPVDTAMSAHLPKGPLWAAPEAVARVACAAIGRQRHRVYAPRYWRLVMWAVRLMPGALLVRLGI